jgi:AcrR family transcriptional regulator
VSVGTGGPWTLRPRQAGADWERLREAVIDQVLGEGYEDFDVDRACEASDFNRDDFDRLFDGKDDCLLRVYEANMADFDAVVFGAFEREESWRDGLRAAAYAAARYLREHPREVVYGELQMREGSDMAQALRDSYLQRIVDMVDEGRGELANPDSIGRGVAEGVCGSIYGYLMRELQSGAGTRSAEDMIPEMMYMAVRPYLGPEVALEELNGG